MVKKRIDMRNGISKHLDKDEKILNVYFLIEEEKSNFYHLCVPVVVTNKAVYFDYKFYSFDSVGAKGGGFQNIKDLVKDIAKTQKTADFNVLCVKNKDLEELENENKLEIENIPYPVTSDKCDRLVKEAKEILGDILQGKL